MKSDRRPQKTAEPYIPERPTLPKMKKAAQACRGCDLYKHSTQVVFGEGKAKASLVFVGEQPGSEEDLEGQPFVGPSGHLLDQMLQAAGIDRSNVYVTNAVKHFKFERQGKRRIHQKPDPAEIRACHPWLQRELELIRPKIVVCLGATAARSVFGRVVTISSLRGAFHRPENSDWLVYVTSHPSAILRNPNHADRDQAINDVIDDFIKIKKKLKALT